MPKVGKIEKTLKPSQRKSITDFADRFGEGPSYEERVRTKKIISAILIAAGLLTLVAVGYFVADLLIKITELPYDPTVAACIHRIV